jgi:hypothetical protein
MSTAMDNIDSRIAELTSQKNTLTSTDLTDATEEHVTMVNTAIAKIDAELLRQQVVKQRLEARELEEVEKQSATTSMRQELENDIGSEATGVVMKYMQ